MSEPLTDWILLNKPQVSLLLLAVRAYKKQPMRPQFAEYLQQAESKLRESLRLMREEEDAREAQQQMEADWRGTHAPGSVPPWQDTTDERMDRLEEEGEK